MVQVLHIQHTTTIGKYLGIHNIVFWNDPLNENVLIKMVKQKLFGWKANTLSKMGRVTLIKSNLCGMSNHVMSYFKCLSRVIHKLNNKCRDFLWGRGRQIFHFFWDRVRMSKRDGGLGIRKLDHFICVPCKVRLESSNVRRQLVDAAS